MAITLINQGTAPNNGTGTPARTAAGIINANFQYLENLYMANSNTVENTYADMAALYAGQANQTSGKFQYVLNAQAHSQVDPNSYAVFEYLGTTTGTEADYRLLSSEETAIVAVSATYNVMRCSFIEDAPSGYPNSGYVGIQTVLASNAEYFWFGSEFSQYLQAYASFKTTFSYVLKIVNRSKQESYLADIVDFDTTTANYVKVQVDSNKISVANISVGDLLEFTISAYITSSGTAGVSSFNTRTGAVTLNGDDVANVIAGADDKDTPDNDDQFGYLDSTDSLSLKNITWAEIVAALTTLFNSIYVTVTNFLQEKLYGTTIFASDVSGTYNVDWNAGSVWDINCNGNTTLADTNLPISGTNKVINIYMDFDNGTEVVTLPGYWIKDPDSDDLDATQRVRLTVEAINNTSDVTYYVKNLG